MLSDGRLIQGSNGLHLVVYIDFGEMSRRIQYIKRPELCYILFSKNDKPPDIFITASIYDPVTTRLLESWVISKIHELVAIQIKRMMRSSLAVTVIVTVVNPPEYDLVGVPIYPAIRSLPAAVAKFHVLLELVGLHTKV